MGAARPTPEPILGWVAPQAREVARACNHSSRNQITPTAIVKYLNRFRHQSQAAWRPRPYVEGHDATGSQIDRVRIAAAPRDGITGGITP
jgi:hypothetical protein